MQILSLFERKVSNQSKLFENHYYYWVLLFQRKKSHSKCSRLNSLNLLKYLQLQKVLCAAFDKVEFKSVQRFLFSFFFFYLRNRIAPIVILNHHTTSELFQDVCYIALQTTSWLRTTDYFETIPRLCIKLISICAVRLCMILNLLLSFSSIHKIKCP